MITLSHQLHTEGHPPLFAATEGEVQTIAQTRLPRPSSLFILRAHSRTGQESWEFLSVVDASS